MDECGCCPAHAPRCFMNPTDVRQHNNMHTCTYAQACTYAHARTHAHTRTQTYVLTHAYTHIHTHTLPPPPPLPHPKHTHTHIHTRIHIHTRTHTHTCTHAHTHNTQTPFKHALFLICSNLFAQLAARSKIMTTSQCTLFKSFLHYSSLFFPRLERNHTKKQQKFCPIMCAAESRSCMGCDNVTNSGRATVCVCL